MKLPGGEEAVVPPGKLETYVLSPAHEGGRDKARVFKAALGLGLEHVDEFTAALLSFRGRRGWVRSGWMVPHDGSPTRLTAAYPIRR